MVIIVCGAGTMGSGIAQVMAMAGYHTILYDISQDTLDKAEANIENSLQKLLTKEKISATQKEQINNQLQFTADINYCTGDVIIEAIVERYDAKVGLFNQLAELNHSETIFASNTSSLSITTLQSQIQHSSRVVGLHFFNPPVLMPLVEIIHGEQTNNEVVLAMQNLMTACKKTAVLCKDTPGFIVNRVARPYYIEALRLAEEGVPYETIDAAMQAAGFKMGPFALMDAIGNDVNYAVSQSVYAALGKPQHLLPSHIQAELVAQNKLGKKTGEGYYKY
jgi:3-hydroxybutyryl-CoA dehydrogenase